MTLTPTRYAERKLPGNPVIDGSGRGWNSHGMHNFDPHPRREGALDRLRGRLDPEPDLRLASLSGGAGRWAGSEPCVDRVDGERDGLYAEALLDEAAPG